MLITNYFFINNMRINAITTTSPMKENFAKTISSRSLGMDLKCNTFLKYGKMGNNPVKDELHTYFIGCGITQKTQC